MQPLSKHVAAWPLLPVMALTLSGCEAIGGIFKAGVWVGVIAVAFLLAVVFGLVRAFSK